mmetsp:Transcript_2342/g.5304  ORF Transcript_2342/g.5304 Transcript_2342/m.5304 type:complete len:248 (-) Transcript_2342:110-853(-)
MLGQIQQSGFIGVVNGIFLQEEGNFSTTSQSRTTRVFKDCEFRSPIGGGPDILGIGIWVLGSDLDTVSHQKGGIETDTELSNLTDFTGFAILIATLQSLQKAGGSTASNSTQVGNHFIVGHSNTSVPNGQSASLAVEFNLNLKLVFAIQQFWLGNGQESDLVKGVTGVGNQFTQKDVLILIKGVDHNVQHARNFGFKLEVFGIVGSFVGVFGDGNLGSLFFFSQHQRGLLVWKRSVCKGQEGHGVEC